jgi:hypothetical protein
MTASKYALPNILVPYFLDICIPYISVLFCKNLCTFVLSSVLRFPLLNLHVKSYSARWEDHFHTWHVLGNSSFHRRTSQNSRHGWEEPLRTLMWATCSFWQSDSTCIHCFTTPFQNRVLFDFSLGFSSGVFQSFWCRTLAGTFLHFGDAGATHLEEIAPFIKYWIHV